MDFTSIFDHLNLSYFKLEIFFTCFIIFFDLLPICYRINLPFFGGAIRHGVWEERCAGCGTCIIHQYDGMCPIARCSKSLMNGPCGGSSHGACEISPDTVCIWDRIVRKKMEMGRVDDLMKVAPSKNWRSAWHGGPRRRVREELTK